MLTSYRHVVDVGYSAYMAYPMTLVSKRARWPTPWWTWVEHWRRCDAFHHRHLAGRLRLELGFAFMPAISALTFIVLVTIREPLDVGVRQAQMVGAWKRDIDHA